MLFPTLTGMDRLGSLREGQNRWTPGGPLRNVFNLTIHHLWGRVLSKFQETRTVTFTDDGYIKTKLSVALQVLTEIKTVFKADDGLELNVSKTVILPKDITQQVVFDVAHSCFATTACRL